MMESFDQVARRSPVPEIFSSCFANTVLGLLYNYQFNFLWSFDIWVVAFLSIHVAVFTIVTLILSRRFLEQSPPIATLRATLIGAVWGVLYGFVIGMYAAMHANIHPTNVKNALVEMVQQFPDGILFPPMWQLALWFGSMAFIACLIQSIWNFVVHLLRS